MKNVKKNNIMPNFEFQNSIFDVKRWYLVPIWTSKHVKKRYLALIRIYENVNKMIFAPISNIKIGF